MNDEILINNRYSINKKVGKGSFGDVHLGYDKKTGNMVAIKLEYYQRRSTLDHEYKIYNEVCGKKTNCHIPKIYWYGHEGDYRVMVMEFLGNSLESLLNTCGRKFSLKTTTMIGIQLLTLLQQLHTCNFIHRDLKPENFLIGINQQRFFIYMIDFGLCKRFKDNERRHMKLNTGKKLVGTARYASVNSHKGIELSRRDDLESLLYLLIYFRKGHLPWQGMPGNSREEKYERIKNKKIETTTGELCKDMPKQFEHFFDHVKSLKFKEKPNYKYLFSLLVSVMEENNYRMDYRYDWG